jgi:hypothetical protein
MSTLNKILTKFSAQEPMKVELFDAKQASVDRDKAFNAAYAGYQMIQKSKANFQKTMFACDNYISKYVKEMAKWPDNSPTAKAYKKAIEDMKSTKREAQRYLELVKKLPTF